MYVSDSVFQGVMKLFLLSIKNFYDLEGRIKKG